MNPSDRIKQMQSEGKSQEEIKQYLRDNGIAEKNIPNYISQAEIKTAISGDSDPSLPDPPSPQSQNTSEMPSFPESSPTQNQGFQAPPPPQNPEEMQPSMLTTPSQQSSQETIPSPQSQNQNYQSQDYQTQNYDGGYAQQPAGYDYSNPGDQGNYGGSYQQYQGSSSDTITEMTEQIVAEKLSPLMNKFQKTVDLKNTLETRMNSLDERLKRIEKIIDTLQLSIMQKIGEHMTSVSDLKKEVVETQKSFKSLLDNSTRKKANQK